MLVLCQRMGFEEKMSEENGSLMLSTIQPLNRDICFFTSIPGDGPVLKLCENGDIYVKGKLVENDKEVVEGMRMLLLGIKK